MEKERNRLAMPRILSKEAADYTSAGSKEEHCSICKFWLPGASRSSDGTCEIVSGAISQNGWCRFFEHEREVA